MLRSTLKSTSSKSVTNNPVPVNKSPSTVTETLQIPPSPAQPLVDAQPPVQHDPVESKSLPVRDVASAIDQRVKRDLDAARSSQSPPAPKHTNVLFQWKYPAQTSVVLKGAFNNWSSDIKMIHKQGIYSAHVPLPPGTYQYKFVVDGTWCYDVCAPTVTDADGNVNNVIVV